MNPAICAVIWFEFEARVDRPVYPDGRNERDVLEHDCADACLHLTRLPRRAGAACEFCGSRRPAIEAQVPLP
jgi:hypothetical protein